MDTFTALTGLYVREKLIEYTDCLCKMCKDLIPSKDEQALISIQFHAKNSHLIMDADPDEDIDFEPRPGYKLYKSLLLEHADDCPYFVLKENPSFGSIQSVAKKNIKYASVAVIMDRDKNVLLTRRSERMYTFPLAWVYPGGMLDPNESFEEGVVREIAEEVGVKVDLSAEKNSEGSICYYNEEKCMLSPFYLWESVFPSKVADGIPRSHVLIMFYYIILPQSFEKIPVKVQESEVDEAVWMPLETVTEEPSTLGRDIASCISEERIVKDSLPGKKGFVSEALVKGVYPNKTGQGIALAHYNATKHLRTIIDKFA